MSSTHSHTIIKTGISQNVFLKNTKVAVSTPQRLGPPQHSPSHSIYEATQNRVNAKSSKESPDPPSMAAVWDKTDTGICSTMKLHLPVVFVTMATFTHMALVSGISCDSNCAACWKDNDTKGTDIKFSCNDKNDCGSACPSGYHGIHCASPLRCM